jgi:hypothetical protein
MPVTRPKVGPSFTIHGACYAELINAAGNSSNAAATTLLVISHQYKRRAPVVTAHGASSRRHVSPAS